jgi:hypothetical protein
LVVVVIGLKYLVLAALLTLAGCGMGKAYSDTGKMFDKYGCMARDIKGQPPCPAEDQ